MPYGGTPTPNLEASTYIADFFENRFSLNGDFSFQNSLVDERRRRVEIPYSRAPGVVEWKLNKPIGPNASSCRGWVHGI